jgi:hypothetical protein
MTASPGATERPRPTLDELRGRLAPVLDRALGGWSEIAPLTLARPLADAPAKLLVRGLDGGPRGVVLCSSPAAPGLVGRGARLAEEAKRALGPELGAAVLVPLAAGELDGLSYAVLPYREPLADARWAWYAQRWRLRPRVLAWLRGVTRATVADATAGEIETEFRSPLERLVADEGIAPAVRAAGARALERLRGGGFRPRVVLAHNDLWKGNLLLAGGPRGLLAGLLAAPAFVVIDWAGARLRGHAIVDLVTVGGSLRLGRRRFRAEVGAHCRALGCEPPDARAHLVAALAALGTRLEGFPRASYLALVERAFGTLEAVLGEGRG